MDEWRKYLPLITRLVRAAFLYPSFLLVWVLSMLTMGAFVIDEAFIRIAAAIWMPFVFFSVARIFAENDDEGNARFSALHVSGFWRRARVLCCSSLFWIDAGFVLGLFLILPSAAGFYHVHVVLFSGFSAGLARLLLCLLGAPLLFALTLLARLSAWQKFEDGAPIFAQPNDREKSGPDMVMDTMARGQWAAHSMGAPMVLPRDDVETISAEGRAWLRRESHKKHFLLQLLGVALIYVIGGFCLYFMTGTLVSAWRILVALGSLRWWMPLFLVLSFVGGFWLFFLLRAIRIRRRFLKNLRKLCAEYGFAVEKGKHCVSSLFHYRHGANFRLHANGKTYDCKLFGAMRRHWDMYFHENGTLKVRRAFRFRRVEFFCFTSEYDFGFESEHTRICIVAPVPNAISAGNERWNRPIDTGTKVGDYRIFSSTGFLNALRRDCVEKDK